MFNHYNAAYKRVALTMISLMRTLDKSQDKRHNTSHRNINKYINIQLYINTHNCRIKKLSKPAVYCMTDVKILF